MPYLIALFTTRRYSNPCLPLAYLTLTKSACNQLDQYSSSAGPRLLLHRTRVSASCNIISLYIRNNSTPATMKHSTELSHQAASSRCHHVSQAPWAPAHLCPRAIMPGFSRLSLRPSATNWSSAVDVHIRTFTVTHTYCTTDRLGARGWDQSAVVACEATHSIPSSITACPRRSLPRHRRPSLRCQSITISIHRSSPNVNITLNGGASVRRL